MAIYYTDVETTGINLEKDKIISIQYQRLDDRNNGKPIGELTILKAWESSEEDIIKKFFKIFITENVWDFIPVMQNHLFDFRFLFDRFKKYCNWNEDIMSYLFDKPFLDIKYMLIMANHLSFKGSGLDKMTNKTMDGRQIPIWYNSQEYDKIEEYIQMEAKAFIDFFQKINISLPDLIKK